MAKPICNGTTMLFDNAEDHASAAAWKAAAWFALSVSPWIVEKLNVSAAAGCVNMPNAARPITTLRTVIVSFPDVILP